MLNRNFFTTLTLFFIALVLNPVFAQNSDQNLNYLNPNLTFEERVDILLNQMTQEEKISQLTNAYTE